MGNAKGDVKVEWHIQDGLHKKIPCGMLKIGLPWDTPYSSRMHTEIHSRVASSNNPDCKSTFKLWSACRKSWDSASWTPYWSYLSCTVCQQVIYTLALCQDGNAWRDSEWGPYSLRLPGAPWWRWRGIMGCLLPGTKHQMKAAVRGSGQWAELSVGDFHCWKGPKHLNPVFRVATCFLHSRRPHWEQGEVPGERILCKYTNMPKSE